MTTAGGASQFSRRRALGMLAASGGTIAAATAVVSSPAFADSGSVECRYLFSPAPTLSTRARNNTNASGIDDILTTTISAISGSCPCGGAATIEYAHYVMIPGLGSGSTGWVTFDSANWTAGAGVALYPNAGVTGVIASAGIRVTCAGPNGVPAVRCRFGSRSMNVPAATSDNTFPVTLSTNNGDTSPPTGIPTCSTALARSAAPDGILIAAPAG